MAYPSTGAPKTELLIGGAWTDISSRVRGEQAIAITRGTASEQARLAAQSAQFTLNNRDGLFTNDNPNSTYYGLLPRNTQIRFTAGTGDGYVRYPLDYSNTQGDRASTVTTPALNVVGDLELRLDVTPQTWRPRLGQNLAAKWNIGAAQRSWALYVNQSGRLSLTWTTDGTTATRVTASATAVLPAYPRRQFIKVTLTVSSGGTNKVDFSTSTTGIDGTYTALGTTVTNAGVTSIFSGTANLTLGAGDDSTLIFGGNEAFRGKFHKFRMYNGITGTVVANPDFTAQTYGTTSFSDAPGRLWVIGGSCRITSDRLRFWGELTAPPVESDVSGVDVFCQCVASGLIRRLSQGANPLNSPLRNELLSRSLTGGWMLEDGSLSTQAAAFVTGVRPAQTTSVTFASDTRLPGVVQAATFTDQTGRFIAVPGTSSTTGTAYFTFYFKLATLPSTASPFVTLNSSGTARQMKISVSSTAFTFDFFASDGSTLSTNTTLFGVGTSPLNQWLAMNILMTTSGGTVSWSARWSNVAATSIVGIGPTTYSGSAGRFTNVLISAATSTAYAGAALAAVHTATNDLNFNGTALLQAANGYFGERAGTRMQRLALAQGVTIEINGDPTQTETMGYQTIDTFVNQVYDCVDADQGILGEARDALALTYRTRLDMAHRADAFINYNAFHLSQVPKATYDDLGIVNDVTVSRVNGSSGQRQITTGSMSISAPPSGIGRYDTALTRNVSSDSRLPDIASLMANRGSWPGARYPNIGVGLHRSIIANDSTLIGQIMAIELGDTSILTNLPSWLPPDDIYLMNRGYSERLGKFTWDLTFNTTPAGPYNTGRWDYTTELGQTRYGHVSSTLSAGITSNATTIALALNSTTPFTLDSWTTNSASYPFDITIGGERMTLTRAPTGTDPQTFANVTRSVNGIVKAHVAGERAQLYRVFFYALSY